MGMDGGSRLTGGTAHVRDGGVALARSEDVPGGVDVRGALAGRELQLDVRGLADERLVRDRLRGALDRARGTDEAGGRARDGGEDGEEGEGEHYECVEKSGAKGKDWR